LLGFQREIAVVGVAHEAVLQTKGIDGLGEVGSEGNDAVDRLRDADGPADLVGDLAIRGRCGQRRWCGLRSSAGAEGK
jgi:hypothetical protein